MACPPMRAAVSIHAAPCRRTPSSGVGGSYTRSGCHEVRSPVKEGSMGAIVPGGRDEARYEYAAMTPATVTRATDAALGEAERLIAAVVSATGRRTFDTTIPTLREAAAGVAGGRSAW